MKSTYEKELSLIYCRSLAQNLEFNNFLKNTTDYAPSFVSLFCFKALIWNWNLTWKVLCLLVFREPCMLVLQIDLNLTPGLNPPSSGGGWAFCAWCAEQWC